MSSWPPEQKRFSYLQHIGDMQIDQPGYSGLRVDPRSRCALAQLDSALSLNGPALGLAFQAERL